MEQLLSCGYALDGVVFNKTIPAPLADDLSAYSQKQPSSQLEFHCIVETLGQVYERELLAIKENMDFVGKYCSLSPFVIKLPESQKSLHSLKDIYRFSSAFDEQL